MGTSACEEAPARAKVAAGPVGEQPVPMIECSRRTGICMLTLNRWVERKHIRQAGVGPRGARLVFVTEVCAYKAARLSANLAQRLEKERQVRERARWLSLRKAVAALPEFELSLDVIQALCAEELVPSKCGVQRYDQRERLVDIAKLREVLEAWDERCPGCGEFAKPGRWWHYECRRGTLAAVIEPGKEYRQGVASAVAEAKSVRGLIDLPEVAIAVDRSYVTVAVHVRNLGIGETIPGFGRGTILLQPADVELVRKRLRADRKSVV